MLVKVRNDDPSRLSSTERTVVAWLQTWRDARALAGIAVFKAHGTDLIVFTPETCVVVAIKAFTERATGTLRCGADEPWTLDGRVAPLEGVQTGTEPLEEILARTDEIARLLRSAPGREQVNITGVVLVVPQFGSRISLDRGNLPEGIDVVRGDGPSSLRSYIMRAAADNPGSWDAAQVGQALGVLGFAAAATFGELTDEGFPAPAADRAPNAPQQGHQVPGYAAVPQAAYSAAGAPAGPGQAPVGSPSGVPPQSPAGAAPQSPSGVPQQAGMPSRPPAGMPQPLPAGVPAQSTAAMPHAAPIPSAAPVPDPAAPTPPYGSAGGAPIPTAGSAGQPPSSHHVQPTTEFAAGPRDFNAPYAGSDPQRYSIPFDPRPAAKPRRRLGSLVPLVLLVFLVVILGLVAMCGGGGHKSTGGDSVTHAPAPTTVRQTGGPFSPSTPTEMTIPPSSAGRACFPLQPNC